MRPILFSSNTWFYNPLSHIDASSGTFGKVPLKIVAPRGHDGWNGVMMWS